MTPSIASRLGLLRHANFARLWSAATVSLFGTQISQIAIPFIATVLLKSSPGEVGLLTTIEFLPFLLFTLPAGVWVDRFPKRRLLIFGDLGRAVMLATIPIAFAFGALTIWQLYVVGFINGVMTVFFDVADQSYLPTILERDELVEGNSKLQVSQSSAQILGQPLGGGVIALLSAPVAVLLDAISYLVSAGLIVSIRERIRGPQRQALSDEAATAAGGGEPAAPPTEAAASAEERATGGAVAEARAIEAAGRQGMRQQIADGLRFILHHEYLKNIAATTATSNLWGNIGFAIFPVFAYRELRLTPEAVGTIGGLAGVGVLLGALFSSRIQGRLGVGRTIVLTSVVFGPVSLLLPIANPDTAFVLVGASMFLAGFFNVVYNIGQVSLRQAITPEGLLGRMNATMRFLVWGTIPIGSVIGAVLSEAIGVRATVWISAILSCTAFLPVLFSSVRTIQTIPTEPPEDPAATA